MGAAGHARVLQIHHAGGARGVGGEGGIGTAGGGGDDVRTAGAGKQTGIITGGTWRLTGEDLGVNYLQYFAKKEER